MTNMEKQNLAQGMALILGQPDIDKIMLNLQEMHEICVRSGSNEEIDIIAGLCDRRGQVEKLREHVCKGRGLTYERLAEASVSEDAKG